MPEGKRPAQFLLRASLLLIALLAAWWLVLQRPMLFLLRPTVEVGLALISGSGAATVTDGPAGEWNFRVPVSDAAQPGQPQYSSIDFTLQPSDVFAFTLSLPVYWAVAIAMSGVRGNGRTLLLGTLVVGSAEVVSVLILAKTIAYSILAQMHQSNAGMAQWLREVSYYLVTLVTPYAVPLVVAVWLDRRFREEIFGVRSAPR